MMIASEIDSCEAVYALLSDKLAIFFSFFSICGLLAAELAEDWFQGLSKG